MVENTYPEIDFVENILLPMLDFPENIAIERSVDEKGVLLSLTVDPRDQGRVIGKEGINAKAIRTLLRALGMKLDARYSLRIVNTDGRDKRPDLEG